jgi:hypothetical protein
MTLEVIPEGLAGAGAAVEALTARLAAANSAAASVTTAVIPPAADPVSLQAAAGLLAHSAQHEAISATGTEELGRSGVGVSDSGVSYATGDTQAAASYLTIRG